MYTWRGDQGYLLYLSYTIQVLISVDCDETDLKRATGGSGTRFSTCARGDCYVR